MTNPQIQQAIELNQTNINYITTYLGSVNWTEVINAGIEAQVDEAKRRENAKAFTQRFEQQRTERAKVVTLYQASRELLPQFVGKEWSEFAEAMAEAYPHLTEGLANKLLPPLAERNVVRSAHYYKDNYLRQYGYITLQDRITTLSLL